TRNSLDNGVTPAFLLDNGFPQDFKRPPLIDPAFQNGNAANWMEPGSQNQPYVQNWNLNVQHELGGNMMLDVAYVGNKGTHLPSNLTTASARSPFISFLGGTYFHSAFFQRIRLCRAIG